jgi:hypothetical protein
MLYLSFGESETDRQKRELPNYSRGIRLKPEELPW